MSACWLDYTPESKELNYIQKSNYNGHIDIYKIMATDWEK